MIAELIVVRVFDFVEVVFIQLPHETSEIRVLEHAWQDRFCELVHVLRIYASDTDRAYQ